MVEIVCFFLTLAKRTPQIGKGKLCTKTGDKDVGKGNCDTKDSEPHVRAFVTETIQKACQSNREK